MHLGPNDSGRGPGQFHEIFSWKYKKILSWKIHGNFHLKKTEFGTYFQVRISMKKPRKFTQNLSWKNHGNSHLKNGSKFWYVTWYDFRVVFGPFSWKSSWLGIYLCLSKAIMFSLQFNTGPILIFLGGSVNIEFLFA